MTNKKVKSACRQRGFLSSRQGLVLLGLLFMTPAFVAWVMHNSSEDGWRPDGTTNRGMLVHPARPLTLPADMQVADVAANDYLQGKWTLLYLGRADESYSVYDHPLAMVFRKTKDLSREELEQLFASAMDDLP